jgi:drug/metabolite transporter (DMT)-like permease
MQLGRHAYTAAFVSSILFSSKVILAKWAYQFEVSSTTLLVFRMAFTVPFFLIILAKMNHTKERFQFFTKHWKGYLLCGFLGYFLSSQLDFAGMRYISASLERMVLFTYPALVGLLAWFVHGRRPSARFLWGFVLSYAGILLIFAHDVDSAGPDAWRGVLLVLGASLTFSVYLILVGPLLKQVGNRFFTAINMILSTIMLLLWQAVTSGIHWLGYPWQVYVAGLALALFCTVIPSLLFNYAVRCIGPEKAAAAGMVGPVATVILGGIFLNESIVLLEAVGILIVLGSAVLLKKS